MVSSKSEDLDLTPIAQVKKLYRSKFTFRYRFALSLRLVPSCAYHFVMRPHRQSVPAIGYEMIHVTLRRRRRDALYDMLFALLLQCQESFVNSPNHPATGQMLYFLSSMLGYFDICLEKRLLAGLPVSFDDILTDQSVYDSFKVFREYIQLFGAEDVIFEHLRQTFVLYYEAYVNSFRQAQNSASFKDVLTCIQFDSGHWLCCLMEVAALFNGKKLDERARQEFYLFGLLGKFADDWVDLARDMQDHIPNLLYALLQEAPAELAIVQQRLAARKSLGAQWWSRACPFTYNQYFEQIEQQYQQIHLPLLQQACDIILLPAIVGYDYDASRWK